MSGANCPTVVLEVLIEVAALVATAGAEAPRDLAENSVPDQYAKSCMFVKTSVRSVLSLMASP